MYLVATSEVLVILSDVGIDLLALLRSMLRSLLGLIAANKDKMLF